MVKKVSLLSLFNERTRRVKLIYQKSPNGPCGVRKSKGRVTFRGTNIKKRSHVTSLFNICAPRESQLLGFRKGSNTGSRNHFKRSEEFCDRSLLLN